jgi:hypothetical protein
MKRLFSCVALLRLFTGIFAQANPDYILQPTAGTIIPVGTAFTILVHLFPPRLLINSGQSVP